MSSRSLYLLPILPLSVQRIRSPLYVTIIKLCPAPEFLEFRRQQHNFATQQPEAEISELEISFLDHSSVLCTLYLPRNPSFLPSMTTTTTTTTSTSPDYEFQIIMCTCTTTTTYSETCKEQQPRAQRQKAHTKALNYILLVVVGGKSIS